MVDKVRSPSESSLSGIWKSELNIPWRLVSRLFMFLIIIYWSRSQNWTLYVFWLVSLEEIDSNASVVNSSWLLSSFELFSSLLICFSLVVNGSFCLSTSGVCWNGSFKSSLSFFMMFFSVEYVERYQVMLCLLSFLVLWLKSDQFLWKTYL